MRTTLLAAALLFAASLATAMEIGGRQVATLAIRNEDGRPHSVTVDQASRSLRVFAGPGGETVLPPGQDIAMQMNHGNWRIHGEDGKEFRIRLHHDHDYRLQLQPYVYGDVAVLTAVIDDGYSHWNTQLATLGRVPPPGAGGPVPVIDPRHHPYDGEYHHRHHYGKSEEDLGSALGEALADAFDDMLHDGKPDRRPPHHGHRR